MESRGEFYLAGVKEYEKAYGDEFHCTVGVENYRNAVAVANYLRSYGYSVYVHKDAKHNHDGWFTGQFTVIEVCKAPA